MVVELAQADQDEVAPSWLPDGIQVLRGDKDADRLRLLQSRSAGMKSLLFFTGTGLNSLNVRYVPFESSRAFGPGIDLFKKTRGVRLLAQDMDGWPAIVAASAGKGRLMLAQVSPDKVYEIPENRKSFAAATSLLNRLLAWSLGPGVEIGNSPDFDMTGKVRVSGMVFVDRNRDNIRNSGEEPARGVTVGFGFSRTVTDRRGRFTFYLEKHHTVALHVLSSGKLESSGSFLVSGWDIPSKVIELPYWPPVFKKNRKFTFVLISDSHIIDKSREPLATQVKDLKHAFHRIKSLGADFCVVLGDATSTAAQSEFKALRTSMAEAGMPVIILPGNHDMTMGPDSSDRYRDDIGPMVSSYQVGRIKLLLGYDFFRDKRQNKWLLEELRDMCPKCRAIIMQHFPPPYGFDKILAGFDVSALFHGHIHVAAQRKAGKINVISVPPALFGGLDRSPAGYSVVQVDKNGGISIALRVWQDFGRNTKQQGRDENLFTGNPIWTRQVHGFHIRAGITQEDNMLFIPLSPNDWSVDKGGIAALNVSTGREIWSNQSLTPILAAPLVRAGRVFAQGRDMTLYEIDENSGRKLYEMGKAGTLSEKNLLSFLSAPVALSTYNGIARLSPKAPASWTLSGRLLWRIKKTEGLLMPSYTGGANGPAGTLFMSNRKYGLIALDERDGHMLWKVKRPFSSAGPPAYSGGVVVVCSMSKVKAFDSRTGEELWNSKLPFAFNTAPPLVIGDIVLVQNGTGTLLAFRKSDGVEVWKHSSGIAKYRIGPYRRESPSSGAGPTVIGKIVIESGDDGMVYLLSLDHGDLLGKVDLGSPVAGTSADSAGYIAATMEGMVYRFEWPEKSHKILFPGKPLAK
ncbi:MAG: PQQ-binding-like beta-propeller repeat protein [Deltaproteobacteria bacterium]|nr:PQQ-binding-like beta-propeller repeat protein [Deltaproteobacteria bacterium]